MNTAQPRWIQELVAAHPYLGMLAGLATLALLAAVVYAFFKLKGDGDSDGW